MTSRLRWLALVPSASATMLCSGLLLSTLQTAATAPLSAYSSFSVTAARPAVQERVHAYPRARVDRLAMRLQRIHHRAVLRRRAARAAARAAAAAAAAAAQQAATPVASSQPRSSPQTVAAGGSGFEQCVIAHESGGNPQAVNPSSGAGGLYQFLPSTWASLGYAAAYPGGAQTAPVSVQEQAFAKLYAEAGTAPWAGDGC